MERDSVKQIFIVTLALSVVCSLVISVAAVLLRPNQQANRIAELRKNVLIAAGLYQPGEDIAARFAKIETRVVDLEAGVYSDRDPATYDQRAAARDPGQCVPIPRERDFGDIRQREKLSLVYLVRKDNGSIDQVILPFYGKGLFSTLYGFLSLLKRDEELLGGEAVGL